MQQIWTVILTAILLFWSGPEALASAPFGVITNIQGKVAILRKAGSTDAAVNLALDPGDRLITEKGASVRFLLGTELFFVLGSESAAGIDDLSPFAPQPSPALTLEFGHLSAGLAQKAISSETNQPVIFTPAATLSPGIATFDTLVGLNGTTALVVSSGNILVKQQNTALSLARGQGMTLAIDGTIIKNAPDIGSPEKIAAWLDEQARTIHDSAGTVIPRLQSLLDDSVTRLGQEVEAIQNEHQRIDALLSEYARAARERSRTLGSLERRVRIQEKNFSQRIKWYQEAVNMVLVSDALLRKVSAEQGSGGGSDRIVDITAARIKTDSLLNTFYDRFAATMPGERKISSRYGRSMVIIPNKQDK